MLTQNYTLDKIQKVIKKNGITIYIDWNDSFEEGFYKLDDDVWVLNLDTSEYLMGYRELIPLSILEEKLSKYNDIINNLLNKLWKRNMLIIKKGNR